MRNIVTGLTDEQMTYLRKKYDKLFNYNFSRLLPGERPFISKLLFQQLAKAEGLI